MDEIYSEELYRRDKAEFRSVRLSVKVDGSIRLDTQDMGKFVEEVWGHDDYEFWIDVPAKSIPKLVFALLRDRYRGRASAIDEFRTFCEREGIQHNFEIWP